MRILIDKGLSAEDILEVAETMDTPARSAGAERQARYRARQAEKTKDDETCDVTRDVTCDVTNTPPLSPPNDIYSNPPQSPPVKQTQRASKACRLPDDWKPKPLTTEIAKAVADWPDGAADRELERFRDWAASASGPNAVKKDWDAAWRNWLRKAQDEGRYTSGKTRLQQRGGNGRKSAREIAEGLCANLPEPDGFGSGEFKQLPNFGSHSDDDGCGGSRMAYRFSEAIG